MGSWWGAETAVSLRPFADNNLSFGAEFRQNLAQNQKNVDADSTVPNLDDRRRSVNWGLFVQDEYHILKPLRITLGVRYDNYETFDAISPRAALVYIPVETTAFKLLYSEAFRAPNAYERFYQDGGTSSVSNPDLKPEKIKTVDAIWEQYFLDNYRSSIGGFYYQVNDLISQTSNDNNMLVYRNIEKAEAVGVALNLEGYWKNGTKCRLSYNWQQATNVSTGALLSNSPRHLAKANANIPLYRQQLFVSPELQYTGPRVTLDGVTRTNDPVTANLTISSRDLGFAGLEASVGVYNLFNVHAQDVAGEEHGQQPNLPPLQIIRQDGINFRFKLSYRF
jgi:iron complex outermembrane receptor protein